jgi:hypothetical protein
MARNFQLKRSVSFAKSRTLMQVGASFAIVKGLAKGH